MPSSSRYSETSSSLPFSTARCTVAATMSIHEEAPGVRLRNTTVVVERNVSEPGFPPPSVRSSSIR